MATHCYARLYYHVIFRTHCRRRMITEENEKVLHGVLRQTLENMGAKYVVLNGVEDHVHMLIAIGIEHDLRRMLRRAKQASSKAVSGPLSDFQWGRGYAIFTVNPYGYKRLIHYITRQKSHHRSGLMEQRHEW